LAYFLLISTPFLVRNKKNITLLSLPLYTISSIYFVAQFFIGVLFILIAPAGFRFVLLTQLLLASLYAIAFITTLIANEHTSNNEEQNRQRIDFIRNASAKLKTLLGNVKEKDARTKIENVYDVISTSPVKSHPDLEQIESQIFSLISELEQVISTGNKERIISLANNLLSDVNDRNTLLKTLN